MMKISGDKIKEISSNLDAGMRSFYNKENGEIEILPDFDSHIFAERDMWKDVINKLDSESDKYIEFEVMPSHEYFNMMEEFIEKVDDENLKKRLIYALNRSKPFRNFKYEIDISGEYRQKWFKFKDEKYYSWVEDQINEMNINDE